MKVAIREQIDIEDEQRVRLADILDGKQSKRQATREEIKDFAWALGSEWDDALAARWEQLFGEGGEKDESAPAVDEPDAAPDDAPEDDEDLLGLGGGDAAEDEEDLLGL